MTMLQVTCEGLTFKVSADDFAAENEGIWDEYPNAMPAIRNGETVIINGGVTNGALVRMVTE